LKDIVSGDLNAGVPAALVSIASAPSNSLLIPKSAIFILPEFALSKLLGFKSR
jgi:hypothetical protein